VVRSAVLLTAWEAFERGDMVEARRAAEAVVRGARLADEDAVAADLAQRMSAAVSVAPDPPSVARALLSRTRPPPRAYWFAAVAVLAALVAFAVVEYGF
jgi:hypothetical protein